MNKLKIKEILARLINIVNNERLNKNNEICLNQIDADITTSILSTDKSIQR